MFRLCYEAISDKFDKDSKFAKVLWKDYMKDAFALHSGGITKNYYEECKKLFKREKPELFLESLRLAQNQLPNVYEPEELIAIYDDFVTNIFSCAKNTEPNHPKWR